MEHSIGDESNGNVEREYISTSQENPEQDSSFDETDKLLVSSCTGWCYKTYNFIKLFYNNYNFCSCSLNFTARLMCKTSVERVGLNPNNKKKAIRKKNTLSHTFLETSD